MVVGNCYPTAGSLFPLTTFACTPGRARLVASFDLWYSRNLKPTDPTSLWGLLLSNQEFRQWRKLSTNYA